MEEKRPTLPKSFAATLASGDLARMIAVFDRCEVDARDGRNGPSALGQRGVPPELIRWLVEHGADVDLRDGNGGIPLERQIDARDVEAVRTLLELGADPRKVGSRGEGALRYAARLQRPAMVRVLLERPRKGLLSRRPKPPPREVLQDALDHCPTGRIPEAVETVELLLAAGATFTAEAQARVTRLGDQFEQIRDAYDRESLPEADAALQQLYRLAGVAPVPPARRHDGVSPIEVPDGRLDQQVDALWRELVPGRGVAATAQGEAIRIVGRVEGELLVNGGMNWDKDHRAMLKVLPQILAGGVPLPDDALQEVRATARRLPKGEAETLAATLNAHVVAWIRANPVPLPPPSVTYER